MRLLNYCLSAFISLPLEVQAAAESVETVPTYLGKFEAAVGGNVEAREELFQAIKDGKMSVGTRDQFKSELQELLGCISRFEDYSDAALFVYPRVFKEISDTYWGYIRKKASQKDANAKSLQGYLWANRDRIPGYSMNEKNHQMAASCYREAIKLGDGAACTNLALLIKYSNIAPAPGETIESLIDESFMFGYWGGITEKVTNPQLLEKVANFGHSFAQWKYGELLSQKGQQADAIRFISAAEAQGQKEAALYRLRLESAELDEKRKEYEKLQRQEVGLDNIRKLVNKPKGQEVCAPAVPVQTPQAPMSEEIKATLAWFDDIE